MRPARFFKGDIVLTGSGIRRASLFFLVGAIAGLFAFTGEERVPLAELFFVGAFLAGLTLLVLAAVQGPRASRERSRR